MRLICFKTHAHPHSAPRASAAGCWNFIIRRTPSESGCSWSGCCATFNQHTHGKPASPCLFHVSHAARPVAWPALCRCLDPPVFHSPRCRSWIRKKGGGMGGGRHCRLMLSSNRPHLTVSPASTSCQCMHVSMCAHIYLCADERVQAFAVYRSPFFSPPSLPSLPPPPPLPPCFHMFPSLPLAPPPPLNGSALACLSVRVFARARSMSRSQRIA